MTDDALRQAARTMNAVRLRCAWSQQITHRDLIPYLIEEAYELIEAIERDDRAEMQEELGDLLWQVLFHAVVAADDSPAPFDIDDIARGLTEKMMRRHPHVFADAVATTPEEVLVHWRAAKAAEKHDRRSVVDGIPAGMPALARAQKLLGRVEHPEPPAPAGAPASEQELGEHLLALVAQASREGWDAERALREQVRGLEEDVRRRETEAGETE